MSSQWWACDKGCGFQGNFDDVALHEQFCNHGTGKLEGPRLAPPPLPVVLPLQSTFPGQQSSFPGFPLQAPQVDIHSTLNSMDGVIRRQQTDIAKLVEENRRLYQDLIIISNTCGQQADVIRQLQTENIWLKQLQVSNPIQLAVPQQAMEPRPHVDTPVDTVFGRPGQIRIADRRESPLLRQVWT